jgi:hypothetical protein
MKEEISRRVENLIALHDSEVSRLQALEQDANTARGNLIKIEGAVETLQALLKFEPESVIEPEAQKASSPTQ